VFEYPVQDAAWRRALLFMTQVLKMLRF
jgi:hypothetical protein